MKPSCADTWKPDFTSLSSLFDPLAPIARDVLTNNNHQWPSLHDYQEFLDRYNDSVSSNSGARIRFVKQDNKPKHFDDHYELRIFLRGEVQTRTENWHDFFQVFIWCLFSQTKAQLNTLHYQASLKRYEAVPHQPNRTTIENAVTLFDECGAIIVSSDENLLELIRQHRWKELFWQQRDTLKQHLHCIIFGHALYEKALQPYTGMTAHSYLLPVQQSFHALPHDQQMQFLDDAMREVFAQPCEQITSQLFNPFPLLGMPGWHEDNSDPRYYDNEDYFRPKK